VYELSPPAKKGELWTSTLLRMFEGKGSNDASVPTGGLILDGAGNLYGVTGYGGTGDCILVGVPAGCGTVYELSPPAQKGGAWTETILYSFPSSKEGYLPNGNLIFDSAGNLYGATMFGGGRGTTCDAFYQYCGAVFKLSPPKKKGGKWTGKVLHAFKGGTDGANPNGGLVLDSKGTIYGTTLTGGNQSHFCKAGEVGCGTAFKLQPPTKKGGDWTEKPLHVFTGKRDGGTPAGGLILDAKGSLYGTADGGNVSGGGIVFRLTANISGHWDETVLHWFSNNGPGASLAGLLSDSVGNLYGTTIEGANSCGAVFRLKPPTEKGGKWSLSVLYSLKGPPDGRYPAASLIFDAKGSLYSTTEGGGSSGYGSVFEIKP
jgi:uncharacterized repeat protein (TIGR03803 family)